MDETKQQLDYANINVSDEIVASISVTGKPTIKTESGKELVFDTLYIMLGEARGIGLIEKMGALCNPSGQLILNEHQQTSIDGLYAAGDVVNSLHQVSVAIGNAAIAATDIHNKLERNYR
jgi:thioredoxin reductase (NADPH)